MQKEYVELIPQAQKNIEDMIDVFDKGITVRDTQPGFVDNMERASALFVSNVNKNFEILYETLEIQAKIQMQISKDMLNLFQKFHGKN